MPYVVSAAQSTVDIDRHANQGLFSILLVAHVTDLAMPSDAARVLDRHFPSTHPPSVTLRALFCVVQC
jgi:hypothetical protein